MRTMTQLLDARVNQLMDLPAKELRLLQDQLDHQLQTLKSCKEKLATAISQKYADKTQALRQQLDKSTGVIRFDDGDIAIKANITKRPKWNQTKLANIAQRVRVNGEDPLEFMAVTYKVPESKYNAWPEHLKSIFRDARTLDVGKQTFELTIKEEQ